jgi:hypothetical protein
VKKSKKSKKIDLNFASLCFTSKQKLLNRSEVKNLKQKKRKNVKKSEKTEAKIIKVKRSEKFEAKRANMSRGRIIGHNRDKKT